MPVKDENVLVSICCITFNHEAYIRQCLDGFIMQKTNFAFEVLVHDDASTDRTADIIKEYEDQYPDIIKPIYQSVNQYSQGVRISLVYQFSRVKGKYIAMCEGDDYWTDPYKLQKQVDFMESHPECGLVHTNYQHYWQGTNTFVEVKKQIDEGFIFDKLILGNQITTLTVLMRALCIKDLLSQKDLADSPLVLDYFLWLFIAEKYQIHFLKDITGVYRSLPESASNTWDEKKKRSFEALVMNIRIFYGTRNNKMYLIEDQVKVYNKDLLLYAFYSQDTLLLEKGYKYLSDHNIASFQDWLMYKSAKSKLFTLFTKLYVRSKKILKS